MRISVGGSWRFSKTSVDSSADGDGWSLSVTGVDNFFKTPVDTSASGSG
jgi:hypothetical protein